MNKTLFWKTDWFVGLLVVLIFLFGVRSDLMQGLEAKAYDVGMRASYARTPSHKIAVIAIDEQSIANLGRWPWPRELQAKLLDILAAAHPKAIGNTVFLFEPQVDPGQKYINKIDEFFQASSLKSSRQADVERLHAMLQEASQHLDNDKKLSGSMAKANDVLLAMSFEWNPSQGKPDQPLPDYVQKNALTKIDNTKSSAMPEKANSALFPISALGSEAAGIGNGKHYRDPADGTVRYEPLVVQYLDQYYPSLSLMLAAKSMNLGPKDIQVTLGQGVKLGNLSIATDRDMRMLPYFYADREEEPAFPVDSFYDVLTGKISPEKYRNKIVLIGLTAEGVDAFEDTPIKPKTPQVLTLAHSVSSILKQDFLIEPSWGLWAEIAVFLLAALYLTLLLPRLGAAAGTALTAVLFLSLLGTHYVLMTMHGWWLQLMTPAAMLVVGHFVLDAKRFLSAERGKVKSDAESAESNRMLGLAFQGQGQLDMAFDKFRKVPIDNSLMDVLYNLALDYERKRQFNKAESVFRYMAEYNPKFRDLKQRIDQTKAMAETVILGGGSPKGNASTLVLDRPGIAKPMLGRYEVEKELGKGAMGVVYLGKDPKISRIVAIKTLALSQEFEPDELEEVKERFFREAETAGRLNHPNIVTIYDAGEEHDLAYIAMEFLKGKDLVANTKADNLLPLPKVLSIIERVAEALGYAHSMNVVHRDIKPANIMYDPENDTLKVTDFGIARITDSSKTKTGMVLGSPSYMSPEQLAGKKIEGQSDLFSLGVSMYQLVCGKLPFQGDTLTQLMYRIANEPHDEIVAAKRRVPPCVTSIINKALAKKAEKRYRTGYEMAEAIRRCAANLGG